MFPDSLLTTSKQVPELLELAGGFKGVGARFRVKGFQGLGLEGLRVLGLRV